MHALSSKMPSHTSTSTSAAKQDVESSHHNDVGKVVGKEEGVAEKAAGTPTRDYPALGPAPLLLSRSEVDELYELLAALLSALDELSIPYVLIAGSLLGAVRSESILFNDDDIDIAIIDDDEGCCYKRALDKLPELLRQKAEERNMEEAAVASAKGGNGTKAPTPASYMYKRRPWPGCDRVKSSLASRVWIDVFVIRRYQSMDDLLNFISVKENGQDQPQEYVNRITSPMTMDSETIFPLYHFDNRKAIELWPREYFLPSELLPVRKSFNFGPVRNVAGPHNPVPALLRFFGEDCFTHYVRMDHSRGKKTRGDTTSWEEGEKVPLSEEQYLPVQHSRRNMRIWSKHCRRRLEEYLDSVAQPAQESENSAEREEMLSSSGESLNEILAESSSSQSIKERTKWFGAAVRRYTADSPVEPNFDTSELRQVMEPHIAKARLKREQSWKESLGVAAVDNGNNMDSFSARVPYPSIRSKRPFLYDIDTFPMHKILADMIGVEDLSLIHEHPIKDKRMLMFSMLDRDARKQFHQCYDDFVTSFAIPLVHSIAMEHNIFATSLSSRDAASSSITYRYQAFPCVRIVRPNDFSIGPHCDVAYGHSIGNINFHIPLTPAFGTNALYAESHPGKEDWHPLKSKGVGLGYMFDGARCLHFALENTTNRTRVSIDFRIAITRCRDGVPCENQLDEALCSKSVLEDHFSSAGPGYYEEAYINMGHRPGPVVVKKSSMPYGGRTLVDPDKRVGFPFT